MPTAAAATEPTLTDANLVLGRLEPAITSSAAAWTSTPRRRLRAYAELGARLGLDARQAARSALMIADEEMANAIRLVGVESGLDPRDFALVAFGGAGPLHARSVASRLGIETLLIPPAPGLCSAFGALIAPPRVDRVQTYYASSASLDEQALFAAVGRVADEAVAALRASVEVERPRVDRFASLRYAGPELRARGR